MTHRHTKTTARLAAALALATTSAACSSRNNSANLQQAAQSLLPQNASVLEQSDGTCTELGRNPNCTTLWFALPPDTLPRQERLLRSHAIQSGWEITHTDRAPAGTTLYVEDHQADGTITLFKHAHACTRVRICADNIHLILK